MEREQEGGIERERKDGERERGRGRNREGEEEKRGHAHTCHSTNLMVLGSRNGDQLANDGVTAGTALGSLRVLRKNEQDQITT